MPSRLSHISTIVQGHINIMLAKKYKIFIIIYLNKYLMYNKNHNQGYIIAVYFVLEVLRENRFFINLKSYWFNKNEI